MAILPRLLQRVPHSGGRLVERGEHLIELLHEVRMHDQRKNRHAKPRRRRDQRLADAARDGKRLACAHAEDAERLDHARNRTEKPQKRRHRHDHRQVVEPFPQAHRHIGVRRVERERQVIARRRRTHADLGDVRGRRVLRLAKLRCLLQIVLLQEARQLRDEIARTPARLTIEAETLDSDDRNNDRTHQEDIHDRAALLK